ncbi:MAG: hypothetical protein AAF902_04045 [Chloroflexota bacterium]
MWGVSTSIDESAVYINPASNFDPSTVSGIPAGLFACRQVTTGAAASCDTEEILFDGIHLIYN